MGEAGFIPRVRSLAARAVRLIVALFTIEWTLAFLVFLGLAGLAVWGLFQPSP
jgi:hypothetical protein